MVTFPREDTDNETFFEDTNMTGKKKHLKQETQNAIL